MELEEDDASSDTDTVYEWTGLVALEGGETTRGCTGGGGDNLAANYSRELADYIIYVIDVSVSVSKFACLQEMCYNECLSGRRQNP